MVSMSMINDMLFRTDHGASATSRTHRQKLASPIRFALEIFTNDV